MVPKLNWWQLTILISILQSSSIKPSSHTKPKVQLPRLSILLDQFRNLESPPFLATNIQQPPLLPKLRSIRTYSRTAQISARKATDGNDSKSPDSPGEILRFLLEDNKSNSL